MSLSAAGKLVGFSAASTLVLYLTMFRAAPHERAWFGCVDVAEPSECTKWKAEGQCAGARQAEMRELCKSTCEFCSHYRSDCSNGHEKCGEWAGLGECDKNPTFMLNTCGKACGACQKCAAFNAPNVQTTLRRTENYEFINGHPTWSSDDYVLSSDAGGVWRLSRKGGDVLVQAQKASELPFDPALSGQWAYFRFTSGVVPHAIDGHEEPVGDPLRDSHGNEGQFVKEPRIVVEEIDCDTMGEEAARIAKLMELPQEVLDVYHNPPELKAGVHYDASYDVQNPKPPTKEYKYPKQPSFLYPEDRPDKESLPKVHYEIVSHMPKLYYFPKFLSDEEADAIRASATPLMQRSGVIPTDGLKADGFDDARTSYGAWLTNKHPHVEAVRRRILAFAGFRKNETEAMQVLRYTKGAKYLSHLDYFDPYETGFISQKEAEAQWDAKWPHTWNRAATFFLYLSDVEEGGETVFPRANGGAPPTSSAGGNPMANCSVGFRAKAKKGAAVLFYDLRPDASGDPHSLHGGCPVVKGVKWSAPNWLHCHVRERGSVDTFW
eukprot:TRINITY_DN22259_c0_g1_i1.p2 TRINITY_DN22259_c0_g1~~TRINITY_DN22259_c0_g1_i1.p2  ORF type:complete len:549 (+),score=224.61 TRINITY_DN22259_c0_g1_i1:79-1725(+)